MAYDPNLEDRIDKLAADWGVGKKKMFGGLGYFINGNMCFGIHKDELIVRATEEQGAELLKKPGLHLFDVMKGRTMKTWFMAGGQAITDDKKLLELLKLSHDYALSLPPK